VVAAVVVAAVLGVLDEEVLELLEPHPAISPATRQAAPMP